MARGPRGPFIKGEVRTINDRNICERRIEVAWRTMVKVPISNSFLERRDARRKVSESLGAGASLAPRTRQRISLGSENDWKLRLRSCQSWKASSLSLGVVVPTSINKYRMKYVEFHEFGKDNLFVCLFVYLFILGRKLNRQNCLLKEVLREREEKEEKENKKRN